MDAKGLRSRINKRVMDKLPEHVAERVTWHLGDKLAKEHADALSSELGLKREEDNLDFGDQQVTGIGRNPVLAGLPLEPTNPDSATGHTLAVLPKGRRI